MGIIIPENKSIQGGYPMRIYADNAATTRMSRTAIEAMLPYMDRIYFYNFLLNFLKFGLN